MRRKIARCLKRKVFVALALLALILLETRFNFVVIKQDLETPITHNQALREAHLFQKDILPEDAAIKKKIDSLSQHTVTVSESGDSKLENFTFERGLQTPKEDFTFEKEDMKDEHGQPYKIVIWKNLPGKPGYLANPEECLGNIRCDISYDLANVGKAHAVVFPANSISTQNLPNVR